MGPGSVKGLVHDEVLPRGTFNKVSSWARDLAFAPMGNQGVWSNNRPHNPLFAKTVLWPFRPQLRKKIQSIPEASETLPTGTPLDSALRAIRRHILSSRFGRKVASVCAGITASVLRYQPISGLAWHLDAAYYTLAFA